VQVRLHQYQRNSELLIALIQLWIFILFALLYSVSPKTFSADSMFAPVPSFLGAYLVITLTRLGLVWTDRLPDWFVYASVVVDIALLYGLMWTFHIQYEQPAAFYLKAPTLLYVFIFIAIRALRFEVRFVLLSGVVAAIGWLVMAGYAIYFDPRGVALTRDYVAYLTSNVGLLGAEVDKIVSIIVVTLTICVAIGRARRMLVRAIVEESTARELSRFVRHQSISGRCHSGDLQFARPSGRPSDPGRTRRAGGTTRTRAAPLHPRPFATNQNRDQHRPHGRRFRWLR
jgi:adenylate cyclase